MPKPSSPVSPETAGRKRSHRLATEEDETDIPQNETDTIATGASIDKIHPNTPSAVPSASSAFRNVSACHRCRLRKNRCDQRLPRCQLCEKAGARCVGYDPITKREIPRSYVYFLEARVDYLETILKEHGVEFNDAVTFGEEMALHHEEDMKREDFATGTEEEKHMLSKSNEVQKSNVGKDPDKNGEDDKEDWGIHNLVSNIGMVSVQGTSDPRYLGSTSGISFARVVFAAVKSSVPGNASERCPMPPSERLPHSATGTGASTMRDSLFGLQTRPLMKCAAFPDRDLAGKLVNLYFEHANPQVPILHRVEFMELLDQTYAVDEKSRSARSLYTLNIVFAIGAGIIFEDKNSSSHGEREANEELSSSAPKRAKISSHQHQPEEYHASAVLHLESFLNSSAASGSFGGLEELQAILLLASFALLRPVAPGLWYIVGVAMRLAVDLGLHYEDGTGIDCTADEKVDQSAGQGGTGTKHRIDSRERGRREWVRDLRRRLWWCVYTFDRLVGCSVGRPFGINDQAISTEFPSLLDDKYITKSGFLTPPAGTPSYKHPAHNYFKLRVLQSEIQDVLQCQQVRLARHRVPHSAQPFGLSDLPSPFLQGFDSLRSWRKDVLRRLNEWKENIPGQQNTGVRFPVEFLELNYWQTVIMLYQQCLTTPAELAEEITPAEEISSPTFSNIDDAEDKDDIYSKVAEAGQKVIRIYRQLHRVRLVNYTYLATHHIFMAGISFLYAVWHSPYVRSGLTLDEVDFTVLAATSVLSDLIHKCPPAEACRDAFERMSKATVQMALSTTGFGSQVNLTRHSRDSNAHHPNNGLYHKRLRNPARYSSKRRPAPTHARQSRPVPQFDMNLENLFGDNNAAAGKANDSARDPIQTHHLARTGGWSELSMSQHMAQTQLPFSSTEFGSSHDQYALSSQSQQQHYDTTNSLSQESPSDITPDNSDSYDRLFTDTDHGPGHQPGMSLDFLDLDTSIEAGDQPWPLEFENPDSEATMPSLSYGAEHTMGIDLGFGMAVDFQHDWSESGNYDMLEGYFFGGGAGSGGDSAG